MRGGILEECEAARLLLLGHLGRGTHRIPPPAVSCLTLRLPSPRSVRLSPPRRLLSFLKTDPVHFTDLSVAGGGDFCNPAHIWPQEQHDGCPATADPSSPYSQGSQGPPVNPPPPISAGSILSQLSSGGVSRCFGALRVPAIHTAGRKDQV